MSALASIAGAAIARPDERLNTASTATLPHHPDIAQPALADRFMVLQGRVDEVNAGKPHTDDELDDLVIAQASIMDEMNDHIVTMLDGHRARANVLLTWYRLSGLDNCPSEIDEFRLWPLCRDLIGGSL